MRKWIAFALFVICVALVATVRVGPTFSPLKPDPGIPTFRETFGYSPDTTEYVPAAWQDNPNCSFPGYPEGARVVLLATERGLAISSASLGGQDVSTSVVLVVVEPGDAPLYVIGMASRAVLWRFSGATQRIRHLVLASDQSVTSPDFGTRIPMGETGVPRDNVTFLPESHCLIGFAKTSSKAAQIDSDRIKDRVGRAPDLMAAREAVTRFSIPSGEIVASSLTDTAQGRDLEKQRLLSFFSTDPLAGHPLEYDIASRFPNGVMQVDPEDVIANLPVERYEILPGSAGLKQLIDRGALQQVNIDLYRILRPIRMPADLSGAHFTLMRGVPRPEGSYRGACVIDQETGQPVRTSSDDKAIFGPMPC
jgi:hypothetical protein